MRSSRVPGSIRLTPINASAKARSLGRPATSFEMTQSCGSRHSPRPGSASGGSKMTSRSRQPQARPRSPGRPRPRGTRTTGRRWTAHRSRRRSGRPAVHPGRRMPRGPPPGEHRRLGQRVLVPGPQHRLTADDEQIAAVDHAGRRPQQVREMLTTHGWRATSPRTPPGSAPAPCGPGRRRTVCSGAAHRLADPAPSGAP